MIWKANLQSRGLDKESYKMIRYKVTVSGINKETKTIDINDREASYETTEENLTNELFKKLLTALNLKEKYIMIGNSIVPVDENLSFEVNIISKEK